MRVPITWERLKGDMADAGSHFFDDNSMRFWDGRTHGNPFLDPDTGEVLFVHSTQFRGSVKDGVRNYKVARWFGQTVYTLAVYRASTWEPVHAQGITFTVDAPQEAAMKRLMEEVNSG